MRGPTSPNKFGDPQFGVQNPQCVEDPPDTNPAWFRLIRVMSERL